VTRLLRAKCAFPAEHLEQVVGVLCNSLSPNTLVNYHRIICVAEKHMGTAFETWIPFSDTFI
jgi:hypothetical protein